MLAANAPQQRVQLSFRVVARHIALAAALGRCTPRHELVAGQPGPEVPERDDLAPVRLPGPQELQRRNGNIPARDGLGCWVS